MAGVHLKDVHVKHSMLRVEMNGHVNMTSRKDVALLTIPDGLSSLGSALHL